MACGLPVVASRWRAIPSVVDEGTTGLLFEPRDANDLADQLYKLAKDPVLREQMARAGRERFEQNYTFSRHIEGMRRVFLETVGEVVNEPHDSGRALFAQAKCDGKVDETSPNFVLHGSRRIHNSTV